MQVLELSTAYQICEGIIRKHSKTFFKAFSLLPREKKNAVWAIYAFCRKVDDIVDEGLYPEKGLLAFEAEFHAFMNHCFSTDDPLWVALHDVFSNYHMDRSAFLAMIKGQKMDLEGRRYQDVSSLLDYSYHVASSVGLMLLPVLAPERQDQLKQDAIHLGYAMQITNILRDVGEDLEKGRCYLPAELMDKHHYSMSDLHLHRMNSSFIAVWEELAVKAERYYELALSTMHLYPLDSRIPVKGAALLYRAILDQIRISQYEVFKEKQSVSNEEKTKIMAMI
ncbi:phytoene/squalene synthase family protein [Falsibacillus albus]|uniref:Phytoene/squalene synthase family protein n=1 Tax=Falsibacillus albus TaxID=2478915 RepID=A0A3L7K9C0_9BACI|nr:phytoene/squalene synthase family protein [Falsibacillus albus]RLQ97232.1 phytoene/squalene synthase family protein [Falsibacillus albus]